jgi:hypothetical protein
MNPRYEKAPAGATARASDDSTPTKGIRTVNKVTTLIPTMKRLQSLDEPQAFRLLDESGANIYRLLTGARLGGNKQAILAAKRLMYRHECRFREFIGPKRIDVDRLIERASMLLLRAAERSAAFYQQPCRAASDFDGTTMMLTLRNVNGVLATYRYNPIKDRLARVDDQAEGGAA